MQRAHKEQLRSFPQRLDPCQLLELGHGGGLLPGSEQQIQAPLLEHEAPLAQPGQLGRQGQASGQLGERLAPPQSERVGQECRSPSGVGPSPVVGLGDQPLGTAEVGVVHVEAVAPGLPVEPVGSDRPAQAGDVAAQVPHGVRGRILGPQQVHERGRRDRTAGREREPGEQDALRRSGHRHDAAVAPDLDRSEKADHEHGPAVRSGISWGHGTPTSRLRRPPGPAATPRESTTVRTGQECSAAPARLRGRTECGRTPRRPRRRGCRRCRPRTCRRPDRRASARRVAGGGVPSRPPRR